MVNSLLGKKIGMTQIYSENGLLVPVTIVQAGPCYVTQIKTEESDGYSGIQIGFLNKKKPTNAELGVSKKTNTDAKRFIREVQADGSVELSLGQELTVDIFQENSLVNVVGITKGKGFAGVIKRWGFSGGPASHGSNSHRVPGSIGSGTDPGRVIKGRKLPGRLGNARRTIRNLDVVKVDRDNNLILIKGAIPGSNGGCVIISKVIVR